MNQSFSIRQMDPGHPVCIMLAYYKSCAHLSIWRLPGYVFDLPPDNGDECEDFLVNFFVFFAMSILINVLVRNVHTLFIPLFFFFPLTGIREEYNK